jgi:arsenite methyltransferase
VGLRERGFAGLARQLAGPHGLYGRLVARQLNKANLISVTAAVDHLDPTPGASVADIGFGGGVGLDLLADRVGPDGVVHGLDPMKDMVRRAARVRRDALADGRLVLHEAVMEALPIDDDGLDGLITCNTIYFLTDLGAGLREIARVLRPAGAAVVGLADPASLRGRPFADHGFVIRELGTVMASLEAAGLDDIDVRTVDIGRGDFHLVRARKPA